MGIEPTEFSSEIIRIDDAMDKAAKINKALVESGLAVDEIHTTNISLEDYYFNLTGGTTNE